MEKLDIVTPHRDQIQTLLAEIDRVLSKASPRLPFFASPELNQQRQTLETLRHYLATLADEIQRQGTIQGTIESGSSLSFRSLDLPPDILAQADSPEAALALTQETLQRFAQDLQQLRRSLLQPLQVEMTQLHAQRDALLQEVRQLERQRQQYGLTQQRANQEELIHEFMQRLMDRIQERLSQQVSQTLATLNGPGPQGQLGGQGGLVPGAIPGALGAEAYGNLTALGNDHPNLPPLHPAQRYEQLQQLQSQTDQMMMGLDATLRVFAEALQQNIQSYQTSLAESLERMHSLGQQGEAVFSTLVSRLADQLGDEALSYLKDSGHLPAPALPQSTAPQPATLAGSTTPPAGSGATPGASLTAPTPKATAPAAPPAAPPAPIAAAAAPATLAQSAPAPQPTPTKPPATPSPARSTAPTSPARSTPPTPPTPTRLASAQPPTRPTPPPHHSALDLTLPYAGVELPDDPVFDESDLDTFNDSLPDLDISNLNLADLEDDDLDALNWEEASMGLDFDPLAGLDTDLSQGDKAEAPRRSSAPASAEDALGANPSAIDPATAAPSLETGAAVNEELDALYTSLFGAGTPDPAAGVSEFFETFEREGADLINARSGAAAPPRPAPLAEAGSAADLSNANPSNANPSNANPSNAAPPATFSGSTFPPLPPDREEAATHPVTPAPEDLATDLALEDLDLENLALEDGADRSAAIGAGATAEFSIGPSQDSLDNDFLGENFLADDLLAEDLLGGTLPENTPLEAAAVTPAITDEAAANAAAAAVAAEFEAAADAAAAANEAAEFEAAFAELDRQPTADDLNLAIIPEPLSLSDPDLITETPVPPPTLGAIAGASRPANFASTEVNSLGGLGDIDDTDGEDLSPQGTFDRASSEVETFFQVPEDRATTLEAIAGADILDLRDGDTASETLTRLQDASPDREIEPALSLGLTDDLNDLSDTDLSDTDLSDTGLGDADLSELDLTGAGDAEQDSDILDIELLPDDPEEGVDSPSPDPDSLDIPPPPPPPHPRAAVVYGQTPEPAEEDETALPSAMLLEAVDGEDEDTTPVLEDVQHLMEGTEDETDLPDPDLLLTSRTLSAGSVPPGDTISALTDLLDPGSSAPKPSRARATSPISPTAMEFGQVEESYLLASPDERLLVTDDTDLGLSQDLELEEETLQQLSEDLFNLEEDAAGVPWERPSAGLTAAPNLTAESLLVEADDPDLLDLDPPTAPSPLDLEAETAAPSLTAGFAPALDPADRSSTADGATDSTTDSDRYQTIEVAVQQSEEYSPEADLGLAALAPATPETTDALPSADTLDSEPDFLVESLLTEDPIAEDLLTEDPLVENLLTEDPLAEDLLAEDPLAENLLAENLLAENLLTEDPLVENLLTEDPLAEDPLAEEPLAENLLTENLLADDPLVENLLSDNLLAENLLAENLLAENLLAEEPPVENLLTEDPLAEDLLAEDLLAEDLLAEDLVGIFPPSEVDRALDVETDAGTDADANADTNADTDTNPAAAIDLFAEAEARSDSTDTPLSLETLADFNQSWEDAPTGSPDLPNLEEDSPSVEALFSAFEEPEASPADNVDLSQGELGTLGELENLGDSRLLSSTTLATPAAQPAEPTDLAANNLTELGMALGSALPTTADTSDPSLQEAQPPDSDRPSQETDTDSAAEELTLALDDLGSLGTDSSENLLESIQNQAWGSAEAQADRDDLALGFTLDETSETLDSFDLAAPELEAPEADRLAPNLSLDPDPEASQPQNAEDDLGDWSSNLFLDPDPESEAETAGDANLGPDLLASTEDLFAFGPDSSPSDSPASETPDDDSKKKTPSP